MPLSRGGSLGGLSPRLVPMTAFELAGMVPLPLLLLPLCEELPLEPLPATLYGSSSGIGMRGRLRISERLLTGGILDLSISMATMLTIMTQQGQLSSSISFLAKAMAVMHCISNLRRSG